MHPFYIRLSRVFIPPSNTRKQLTLPFEYPSASSFSTSISIPVKSHLKNILSTNLLKEIVSALLTDVDAWSTKFESSYVLQAQWIAEHFLIWLYELDMIKERYKLSTVVEETLHANYTEYRNMFCKQFPVLHVSASIPCFENRNFWVALQAFNFYRFQMCDSMETYEESAKFCTDILDFNSLDSTSFAEVQFIYATRVRENAVIAVLLAAGDVMKDAKPTSIPTADGLMRKFLRLNPQTTTFEWKHKSKFVKDNISGLLALVRTILHLYYKIRLVVDITGSLGNVEQAQLLIQSQASWCENRIPSLLALKATSNQGFFNAIRNFEASCINEGNCLTSLVTSQSILEAVLNANNLHFLKPSFLRLNLALMKENLDEKLFQKLSTKEQEKINVRFAHVLEFTKPTVFPFLAFMKLYQFYDAKFQSHDSIQIVTQMLVNKEFYSTYETIMNNPLWITSLKNSFQNPVPYSLRYVLKMYQKAIGEKMEGKSKVYDGFGNIEVPEQEFVDLVQLAKVRGWEDD